MKATVGIMFGFRTARANPSGWLWHWLLVGAWLSAALGLAPARVWADIGVEIQTIGYPSDGFTSHMYRMGSYAPLGVRLTLQGEDPRAVYLRIELPDRDGDVVYSEKLINLTPDLLGVNRTHWMYFQPNPSFALADWPITVYVLDEDRQAIEIIHQQEKLRKISIVEDIDLVDANCHFILSIGTGTAGRLRQLGDEPSAEQRFSKPNRMSHISPEFLPDHWVGLEMVDTIVWEDADPQSMTSLQMQAILDWVDQGGHLLIASSHHAVELGTSMLGPYLPVSIEGLQVESDLAPLRRATGLSFGADVDQYDPPIQMAQCALREHGESLVKSRGGTQVYLSRKFQGHGMITFLCITLRDLFTNDDDAREFFRRVLQLRIPSYQDEGVSKGYNDVYLFESLHEPINFKTTTTVYLLLAIIFIIAYALSSTFGSWYLLKLRNRTKHSWTVFALCAVVCSVLGLIAVQAVKGVGYKLSQVTIIDTEVDTYAASAHAYFGVKTPIDVDDLDFHLPQNGQLGEQPERSVCYLRPLSQKGQLASEVLRFTDTRRYQNIATQARMVDIPIRATLKQLEGYWKGQMPGQVHARVTAKRGRTGIVPEIEQGSFVVNELGFDLRDCYLIQAGTSLRMTNTTGRNHSIIVHPVGSLPTGVKVDLYDRLYSSSVSLGNDVDWEKIVTDRMLHKVQDTWVDDLGGGGLISLRGSFEQSPFRNIHNAMRAAMLASTFGEYEAKPQQYGNQLVDFSRTINQNNCRWLDCSRRIGEDTMLLVGLADAPGPIELYHGRTWGNYRVLRPDSSLTIVRVMIPIGTGNADLEEEL